MRKKLTKDEQFMADIESIPPFSWDNYLSIGRQKKYREAQAEKGLVRITIWVDAADKKSVLDFVQNLKNQQENRA